MPHSVSPILLLFGLALAGCSPKVGKSELGGQYAVTIDGERQTIRINSNGTYDNEFYRENSLVWHSRNRWSYKREPGLGDAITFDEFQFGLKAYDNGTRGFWIVDPERSWSGAIELCFDPDLNNRCFVKESIST